MRQRNERLRLGTIVVPLLLLLACGKEPPPPPPVVKVKAAEVLTRDVPIYMEAIGETRGNTEIEIRARVEGFLESVDFAEGSVVRKGQLLYRIDPSPFEAALTQSKAKLAQAEANKRLFEQDPARYTPAFGGYCGYAASINKLSPISPEFFQVLDGRLVLQHNQRAWDLWNKDVAGNLRKADENWPGRVKRNARPGKLLVNVDRTGLALQGYDPVAYFTAGRPLPGKPEFSAVLNGARYHFADAANKEAFEREPARYEPQFGGYCGYAAWINKVSPISVEFWEIIDGRLVLQHSQRAWDAWHEDVKGPARHPDTDLGTAKRRLCHSRRAAAHPDRRPSRAPGHPPAGRLVTGTAGGRPAST